MIIDFHTHIAPPWLREKRAQYAGTDASFDLLYANPLARLSTADELVASMDEAGIDVSVALNVGWNSHELCVSTNDYILESIARFPKRLIGFCAIQPGAGEAAVRELERCATGGARGIGELRPDSQNIDVSNAGTLAPLAEVAEKHNMIMLTHSSEPVGHRYPGKGVVTPGILTGLIDAFKGVTVVCAHWGGGLPFYWLMPEVERALHKTYFDTAATRYLYKPSIYRTVSEVLGGAGRILMGSDYPLISQARQLQEVRALDLPEDARAAISGGNAERLLFGVSA